MKQQTRISRKTRMHAERWSVRVFQRPPWNPRLLFCERLFPGSSAPWAAVLQAGYFPGMSDATTPVILSACRTPIGKYLGGLSSFTAPQLGAIVIREAVQRAGINAELIDEVILGHVLQGGAGQAPARQAAIHAGLPGTVPAVTINKVCGSGLKAVMLGAQAIKAGDAQVVVAGGMEAMSASPHYVYGMRQGVKAGNQTMVDGMIHDGLWDSFGTVHMGSYAEYTAQKAGITRKDQDEYAYQSHRKAVAAIEACRFKAEIVPV